MSVFILGAHYPSGQTWATFLVCLVMLLKYKDGHKKRYASGRTFASKHVLNNVLRKVVRLDA